MCHFFIKRYNYASSCIDKERTRKDLSHSSPAFLRDHRIKLIHVGRIIFLTVAHWHTCSQCAYYRSTVWNLGYPAKNERNFVRLRGDDYCGTKGDYNLFEEVLTYAYYTEKIKLIVNCPQNIRYLIVYISHT